MNSDCRFREAVVPETFPVRVSKAANRFNAPHRPYSCSTRVGRSFPGRQRLRLPGPRLQAGHLVNVKDNLVQGPAAAWRGHRSLRPGSCSSGVKTPHRQCRLAASHGDLTAVRFSEAKPDGIVTERKAVAN